MQTASTQCWWMAQALRSHNRWWLVVSSDEMSSECRECASRSRTSMTDRRLIQTCQPRRTTWKIVFYRTSIESLTSKHGWTHQKGRASRHSTNTLLTVVSGYKSHRLSTCLRPLNYVVLFTTITCRFKVRPYISQLSSVTSSISDDPLIHSKTVFCNASNRMRPMQVSACRPFIGAGDLRPYII